MKEAATHKQFERAAIFRDQLRAIERLEGSQKVYLPRKESFDAISVAHLPEQSVSAANVFQIRAGRLLNKNTFLLRHRGAALPANVVRQFLLQYYRVAQDIPPTILLPLELSDASLISRWINGDHPPHLRTPRRGQKRQLLVMGQRNAQQLLEQEIAVFESDRAAKAAVAELARALGLQSSSASPASKAPVDLRRIETYDISNIQGVLATGSMVVFTDGKPDKKHYRKFKVRLPEVPNDFAMLQEVLTRRLSAHHQDWPQPDLMLIDGGKGQLNAAHKVLRSCNVTSPLAALAKREETLFTRTSEGIREIRLPYDSPALFLVQRMRDEAHRFTLSYHQLLREKQQRRSLLDEVPGIGPKTKKRLLNHFGSLKAIRTASVADLSQVIGSVKAKILQEYL
jgi:excinuclease ABC subunit C